MRRFGRLAAAALLALSASGIAAGPVAAADPVTFGQPRATSAFGESIEFDQPVELSAPPSLVELLLSTPGAAGPNVTLVELPAGDTAIRRSTSRSTSRLAISSRTRRSPPAGG